MCHDFTAQFDDPNLVSCAGLAPVLRLAERAGFGQLVAEHVRIGKPEGVNADLMIASLVAGMVAGADSIDDMALLRHGGDEPAIHRGPGTIDLGELPAHVHLRACPSTRRLSRATSVVV